MKARTIKIVNADLLKNYPCDVYLHNALRFLRSGYRDSAYEEISEAIFKSGGQLTDEEVDWMRKEMPRK